MSHEVTNSSSGRAENIDGAQSAALQFALNRIVDRPLGQRRFQVMRRLRSGRVTPNNPHLRNTMQQDQNASIASDLQLQLEVAQLMIECLNLEVTVEEIAPDEPLYGEGLGLDSIDVLEVALVVSKRYGLQLRADSQDNRHIFSSLRSLCDYIATKRTC
jgi:acyl carrier protein